MASGFFVRSKKEFLKQDIKDAVQTPLVEVF